jgi:hypothetical protein
MEEPIAGGDEMRMVQALLVPVLGFWGKPLVTLQAGILRYGLLNRRPLVARLKL